MKKPPKLRKTKRAGKEIGAFFVEVKGQRIWLGTKDPDEARRRRALAMKGQRKFDSGAEGAADTVLEALDGTRGAGSPLVVELPRPEALVSGEGPATASPPLPQTSPAVAALPPIPTAQTPSSAQAVKPDGYAPPKPSPGWADSVRDAAQETAGAAGAARAAAVEEEEGKFTPEELDEILEQAADFAVNGQIELQRWAASKGWIVPTIKIRTGEVPADNAGRARGRKIWKRWFKKLAAKYAPELDMPDWVVAPVLVAALTLGPQLEGASIITPEDEAREKAAKEAAQDAPAPVAAAA